MATQEQRAAWWRRVDPLVLAWIVATALAWGQRGFLNTLGRDSSFYLYAGQAVVAGNAPYEAVMNRAGPLAQLFPALGVAAGRTFGLGDVGGTRALFFVMTIAAPALVYVLVRHATSSRLAGSAGAATMLCFQGIAAAAANGPGSKTPMLVFMLIAMLLLQRRHLTAAGIATGLATLTWQPVLFALLPAGLVVAALGQPGVYRRVQALWFGLGGAITLALTVAGFAAVGALDAFVDGYWTANALYTEQPGVLEKPNTAWALVVGANGWTSWVVVSGWVAAILLGLGTLHARARRPHDHRGPAHTDSLALAALTLGGLAWCLIAFNAAPDALLLLPSAACGIGGAVGVVLRLGASPPRVRRSIEVAAVAWVVVSLVATTYFTTTIRTTYLVSETAAAEALFSALPDDATVFAAEAPQPLAMAGKRSISRYVLFGNGMASYINGERAGGLAGYRAWLDEAAPTLVVIPDKGIRGLLEPVLLNYVPVGASTGWIAYLHEDIKPAIRARVRAALDPFDPSLGTQEP